MTYDFLPKRLGDNVQKIGSGATPRGGKEVYKDSGISLIRSQNVYNNYFSYDGLAFIDEEQADKLSNVTVESEDILLNITGDSVARVCQAPDEVLPARVNQHVSIIRPDPDVFDVTYLRYFLVSPKMQNYMLALSMAGATRKALTKGMIEDFKIPCPELKEQKAIAAVLSAFDDKIELNRQMNATLEEMARALFKSWFVDFDPVRRNAAGGPSQPYDHLFPDKLVVEDGREVPEGWNIGLLEDFLVLKRGYDLPQQKRVPGQYPILAASGLSGTHKEFKVKGPGVTTGRSGVLGNVFFVHEDFWPLNTSLYVQKYGQATPLFAYHLLKTLQLENYNAGSAVPTLNRNHVHSLPLILPSKEIIKTFESFAKPLFEKCRVNEHESQTLTELRDTLLPHLMSGHLRVPLT